MRIEYLADHLALLPPLAELHQEQWGYLRPDETLERRIRRLEAVTGRGGVPSALVALEGEDLVGSAMLIANDMTTRPELTPWLAGVCVVDTARGRGYGSALVARVEREAAAAGVGRLYLYTPSAADFYALLGWETDEETEYLGQSVVIMSKPLAPVAATR